MDGLATNVSISVTVQTLRRIVRRQMVNVNLAVLKITLETLVKVIVHCLIMFSYSHIEKTLIIIRRRFNGKMPSFVVNVLRNCDIYCCKMCSEKTKSPVLS